MKETTETAVEEANAAFYKALGSRSIEEMDRVWMHMEWVSCVHPGWDLVLGWEAVRQTWGRIFEGGQRMRISSDDVNARTCGDIAWVTCVENITVFEEANFASMQTVATNIFLHQNEEWKLIHHHASQMPVVIADVASDTVQ